ncbi:MAG: hypothetical protein LBI01_06555 [Elusimicrobium sp.]|jgi:hypothetical protein|nr:hypothetical protein [Elusimicrobium sp.]
MNRLLSQILGVEQEKVTDCLGLYISPTDMFLAQTVKKGSSLKIEGLIRVPVPPIDKNLLKPLDLNEAFFAKPENWLEPLNNAISKKKWRTKKIIVSLSPSFSILRHFVMPMVDRKFWKQSIPLQARKYIHYPFEKSQTSYSTYIFETAVTKQKRIGVIFGMTSNVIRDAVVSGLRSIGFDVLAVEISAFSAARAYASLDKEAVSGKSRVYSFFGAETADFIFINNNLPVLARDMDISGPLPIERRRLEMSNYIDFVSKQTEKDSFEEVVITGQNVDEWKPVVESDARKPVRNFNTNDSLGFETRNIGELSAIGACSKFVDESLPNIDVSGKYRKTNTEISAILTAWKLAVLAILITIGVNIMSKLDAVKIAAELKKEKASAVRISDFTGMTSDKVIALSDAVEAKKKEYENMTGVYALTPLLAALGDVTPPEIYISKFTYRDLFDSKKGFVSPYLEMEGYINSVKGDWKSDIDLGAQYKDKIAANAVFAPICKPDAKTLPMIDFPIETSAAGVSDDGVKKGTRFIIKCDKNAGVKKK